jgi:hypothetical protein
MTDIDPDFPFHLLDEENNTSSNNTEEENVRAADEVVREQLIPDNPFPNTNNASNNHDFYSNIPPNVFNMTEEEQIAYIEQLSFQQHQRDISMNAESEIQRKIREDEEERIRRAENMKRMTEEYWDNKSKEFEPIIKQSKMSRIDPQIRESCILVENMLNKSIEERRKFIYMNEEEYNSFYLFIEKMHSTDPTKRTRIQISDELYDYIQQHFMLNDD